jgi:hypothetical protein
MGRRVGAAPRANLAYRMKVIRPALPRRIGVHEVGDTDTETRHAGVEHLDALAWGCRWPRPQVVVGKQLAVGHLRTHGLRLGYTWATNRRR